MFALPRATMAFVLALTFGSLFPEKSFAYQIVREIKATESDPLFMHIAATSSVAEFEAPWAYTCSAAAKKAERQCEVSETVIMRAGDAQANFKIVISLAPPERTPAMMVSLPNGIYLPAGIRITIDDKEWMPAAIQTCDSGGCYVGLPIDKPALIRLESGKSLEIHFQSLARQETTVPASLTGLSEALDKIQ